jgi:integrase
MKVQYITSTSNSIFKYRRKTPKELLDYIPKREIIKALGKNIQEANRLATEYNMLISSSIELARLSSIPNEIKQQLIYEKLSVFISTKGNAKLPTDKSKEKSFKNISEVYLNSLSVVHQELRDRTDILCKVYPSVFKVVLKVSNPDIETLKHKDLVKVRDILKQLPKRNISKYRHIPIETLVSKVVKGTIQVQEEEKISLTTLNKYIKCLSSLCTYSVRQNYILSNPAQGLTIKQKTQARDQRQSLSKDELEAIDKAFSTHPLYGLFKILRYTGMRLSEVAKCEIKEIDNVLCFDLRTPNAPLKTLSSYRVIPIHQDLMSVIDNMQRIINLYPIRYMSKLFTDIIHRTLEDTQGKSLYSLRHTFATTLIAKDVSPEIVSELMGHSHSTMTMNRYVKGYPIATLKEAIDKL